jgi:hypothetical protein
VASEFFFPDKSSTWRIGIVPNIGARPTIAGILAGRDEVLEEALRQILGGPGTRGGNRKDGKTVKRDEDFWSACRVSHCAFL